MCKHLIHIIFISFQLFKSLNHLGVCQSRNATRKRIDTLCKESDVELQSWKDALVCIPLVYSQNFITAYRQAYMHVFK